MKRRIFLYSAIAGLLGLLEFLPIPAFLRKDEHMLTIRKSNDRGYADHGWLKSRHTFSFADYYNPEAMGFGPLRVINEDRIAGGTGFGTHGHANMEIISYVISGGLTHKDSMGNAAVILPGEVQRMSAGTGVRHSEQNEKPDQEAHFFQIWIMPKDLGVAPGYGQKSFEKELNEKNLVLVVSPDGRDGSITIHQDANMYISRLKKDQSLKYETKEGRRTWIQLVKGAVKIDGQKLEAGDAASAVDLSKMEITSAVDSEMILFDLP